MKFLNKLSFISALCIIINTSAQQEISTEWATQVNSMFSAIDKSKVPNGILLDYGMEFTNVPAFNGTLTDSTYINYKNIREIYNTLLMSRIRDVSAGFVAPQTFENNWQQARGKNFIALGGLFFKYGAYAEDALSSGKVQYTNGKFYDVAGKNPYVENKVFAITPPVHTYTGYTVNVKLPQNVFYTNAASEIQKIEMDFGDGSGFFILPTDQFVSATYTSEGVKTWTFKLTLTSGQTLLAQSKIMIYQGLSLVDMDTPNVQSKLPIDGPGPGTPPTSEIYFTKEITATTSYPGTSPGKARLIIDDAGNNGIRKPLIVVTGFDMDRVLNPENLDGQQSFIDFQRSVYNSSSFDLPPLITGNNLVLSGDQTYDIIFIKWQNGMDYIQNNAYVLQEVIKWVNQQKALNGSAEKNVVLGQSMGGLVSRYALRDLELKGQQHQTRMFINQDGPQQGANMPLGYQAAYRHAANIYVNSPVLLFGGQIIVPMFGAMPVSVYISLLDQPATRQLLKNRMTMNYGLDNSTYNSFQTELKNKGYPTNEGIRNIAVSNGSECGNTEIFNAGDKLSGFNFHKGFSFWGDLLNMIFYAPVGGVFGAIIFNSPAFLGAGLLGLVPGKSTYDIDVYANSLSYNAGATLYHNKMSYTKKIFWIGPKVTVNIVNKNVYQPSGVLPFDYYGGGYIDFGEIDNLSGVNTFTLTPTPSALDIGNGNVALSDTDYKVAYNGANPPPAPKNTPFANFITAYNGADNQNGNEYHLQFTSRNGNWLAAEINNNSYEASCTFMCSSSEIAGETVICSNSSETYSVPAGATTYNWTLSGGNGTITMSGNGTPEVTLTNTGTYNGGLTLTVTMSGSGCGTKTLSKKIWVGKPNFQVTQINDPTYYNESHFYISDGIENAINPEDQGITQITWTKISSNPPGGVYLHINSQTGGWATGPNNNWTMDVKVQATNACGTTDYMAYLTPPPMIPCETYILVKTDGVSDNYSILHRVEDPCPGIGKQEDLYQIKVANSMGTIVISKTGNSFDLSSFPSGMYVVNISRDNKVIINQTLVKN